MTSPTRLANKTIWALEDMLARLQEARANWRVVMRQAEKRMDVVMLVALARLRDELAEVERLARDARRGDYNERSRSSD